MGNEEIGRNFDKHIDYQHF